MKVRGKRVVLRPVVRGSRERGQLRPGKGTHGGRVSGVSRHASSGWLVTWVMAPGVRCLWVSVPVGGVGVAGHGAHYLDVGLCCLGAGSGA